MVSDWFETDNVQRTVKQLLVDALKETKVDFYRLDPVVQTTLLDEAMQVGVQHSLEPLLRIKTVMEGADADESFLKQMITEIYRERGKTPLQSPRMEAAKAHLFAVGAVRTPARQP